MQNYAVGFYVRNVDLRATELDLKPANHTALQTCFDDLMNDQVHDSKCGCELARVAFFPILETKEKTKVNGKSDTFCSLIVAIDKTSFPVRGTQDGRKKLFFYVFSFAPSRAQYLHDINCDYV